MRKYFLNLLHPLLSRVYKFYAAKRRNYQYEHIRIVVFPGVFHPGLFFSTKVLLAFIKHVDLEQRRVLELGCGTGIISIFCHHRGAQVTASDISDTAIQNVTENARVNKAEIQVIKSDLFDAVSPEDFDIIIINPPYYPAKIVAESDYSWFCGESFDYFRKLFEALESKISERSVFMILSEDCDLKTIRELAKHQKISLNEVHREKVFGEENSIFQLFSKVS